MRLFSPKRSFIITAFQFLASQSVAIMRLSYVKVIFKYMRNMYHLATSSNAGRAD